MLPAKGNKKRLYPMNEYRRREEKNHEKGNSPSETFRG